MGNVRAVLAGVALCALIGCGSDSPSAPSPLPDPTPAPPAPPAAVTALTVANSGPTAEATYQMTATALYADGSTTDVTSTAAWATSDAQVATVSSSGLVTGRASGTVEVSATYQGVSGARQIDIVIAPPITFTLSGTVREVAPGNQPIVGAIVRMLDGRTPPVSTDTTGAFRFTAQPAGRRLIEITMPGFEVWNSDTTITDRDVSITVALYPVPPSDASGTRATARCGDGTWSWAASIAAACTANAGVAYTVCPGPLCTAP
jgi:hypothetical protein